MKKFLKKVIAKITGLFKYLRHLGQLIQTLKVISNILPQISVLLPEANQQTISDITSSLTTIVDSMEKTEVFLNSVGIATTTDLDEVVERSEQTLENNVAALKAISQEI